MSSMFTRILAPLDGTARAEEAIPVARALASDSGAQIYLLHVDAASAPVSPNPDIQRRLEDIAQELRGAGVATHVLALSGQASATIAAVAEVHNIDLIVMAPEARGAFGMLRHPSVTAGVLAKSPTPTLLVPLASVGGLPALLASGGASIIVPLDGSPLAEQALPLAARLAERYQRRLLLARVIPPLQVVVAGPGTYPLLRDAADSDLRDTHAYLSAIKGRIQQSSHVPVEWMVLNGIPANELLSLVETKPDSVVVMSTHGRSGFARILLGSVALAVARQASVPVFVVPVAAPDKALPRDFATTQVGGDTADAER
jgi:nucleotide-binding universal stress UspA family protein